MSVVTGLEHVDAPAHTKRGRLLRQARLYALDLLAALAALQVSMSLQFNVVTGLADMGPPVAAMVTFVAICAVVFTFAGLYNRHWRYASIADLIAIGLAVGVSCIAFAAALLWVPPLAGIPPSLAAIQMFVLLTVLSAIRLLFRRHEVVQSIRFAQKNQRSMTESVPILLVGSSDNADIYLRALRHDPQCGYDPVGLLDDREENRGLLIRNVRVLGTLDEFHAVYKKLAEQGREPRHLVFTDQPANLGPSRIEPLIQQAEGMGVGVFRFASPTEFRNASDENGIQLRRIELTDLLERPQAALDKVAIRDLVSGRRVIVTGAGGSIGSELSRQVAALEPQAIILVESCEYNLYAVDMAIREAFPHVPRLACLCDVRDVNRVNEIFAAHRPDLVFHTAALKHVPMVEHNPCEGVLTNVIGTRNVARAAADFGATAMVQVSTDKVVNPTSVMGATKRIAELYCQALDLEAVEEGQRTRFLTVRFGNVLGSSGSLIPLFQRQLEQGGPLTVTDARMSRFFMTIREAVELTLHAAAHGVLQGSPRGEICVLEMGKPVKIIDIAKRMIRLAGRVPDEEIGIEIVGIRPGEKLFEELFDDSEMRVPLPIEGVMGAVPAPMALDRIERRIGRLQTLAGIGDDPSVIAAIATLLPNYKPGPLWSAKVEEPAVSPPPAPFAEAAAAAH